MTELFGITDPRMLDRAASLGHAMQLTNILRDVGEDLEAGRLYLPTSWLAAHGLDRRDLERMAETGRIDPRYEEMIERLVRVADAEYDHAAAAIERLPNFYRRPVAVAADVYRGIHDAIRANGYDNLTRRAYTSTLDKLKLGAGALWSRRKQAARSGSPASSLPEAVSKAAVFGMTLVLAGGSMAAGPAPAAAQEADGLLLEPAPIIQPVEIRASTATARAFYRIGELWIQGVDREESVEAGLEAVAGLRASLDPSTPAQDRLLRAYEGSFRALLGKHGGWPGERLRNLREGNALMDSAVAEAPDDVAVRYIRLMSGFYLPGFLGRGEKVDADLTALIQLLPESHHRLPDELVPEVVLFVLEHGEPTPEQRARIGALLP
jgi:hypothetical protein